MRARLFTVIAAVCASCATVLLSGCGARQAPAVVVAGTPATGALSLLVEPNQGFSPIYELIDAAQRTINLTMYELADQRATSALEKAAARGVVVRVILDKNREQATNRAAFDELAGHGVRVAWADSRYAATHEKAIVVDHAVAAIMSLNLTSRYYSDTRDFAVLDRQPADVAALEQVFDADFRHTKTATPPGDDLVWSPGSQPTLLRLVNSATSSLLVENEEMALPAMTSALEAAARRGVRVTVVMTNKPDWASAFGELAKAGVRVRVFSGSGLYIHAKAIVADAQTSGQQAFVGSENFSSASLNRNRELGIISADPALVGALAAVISADAASASSL